MNTRNYIFGLGALSLLLITGGVPKHQAFPSFHKNAPTAKKPLAPPYLDHWYLEARDFNSALNSLPATRTCEITVDINPNLREGQVIVRSYWTELKTTSPTKAQPDDGYLGKPGSAKLHRQAHKAGLPAWELLLLSKQYLGIKDKALLEERAQEGL